METCPFPWAANLRQPFKERNFSLILYKNPVGKKNEVNCQKDREVGKVRNSVLIITQASVSSFISLTIILKTFYVSIFPIPQNLVFLFFISKTGKVTSAPLQLKKRE